MRLDYPRVRRGICAAMGLAGLLLVVGCSGGGHSASLLPAQISATPAAPSSKSRAQLRFVLKIPKAKTSATVRRPAYVSPNTGSVAFVLDGGSPDVIALNSQNCTAGNGTQTCSLLTVVTTTGPHRISVMTYQSSDGSGPVLSQELEDLFNVNPGINTATFSLGGVVATAALNLAAGTTIFYNPLSVSVSTQDASGATIVGADTYYGNGPLTVSTDNRALIAIGPADISNPSQSASLYCGGDGAANILLLSSEGTVLETVPVTCQTIYPQYDGSSGFVNIYLVYNVLGYVVTYARVYDLRLQFNPPLQAVNYGYLTLEYRKDICYYDSNPECGSYYYYPTYYLTGASVSGNYVSAVFANQITGTGTINGSMFNATVIIPDYYTSGTTTIQFPINQLNPSLRKRNGNDIPSLDTRPNRPQVNATGSRTAPTVFR